MNSNFIDTWNVLKNILKIKETDSIVSLLALKALIKIINNVISLLSHPDPMAQVAYATN